MPEAADIREWRGHDVIDAEGRKIGTDGELPAGDEEAIFQHYGLAYRASAAGERQLGRR